MPGSTNAIDDLVVKFLQGRLTEQEQRQLDEWINASENNRALFEKLTSEKWVSGELETFYSYDEEAGWNRIRRAYPLQRPPVTGYGFYPYLGIGDPAYLLDETGYFKDTIIGKAEPRFYGGFTNTFTYKNISLIALITYSYGGDVLYLADVQNHDLGNRTNKSTRILDHWSAGNPASENPRLLLGESSVAYAASNNVYDASFIRLKSITLSYEFSKNMLSRLKLRSGSVYVSASNLFTITNYPGPDPEVSNDPYSIIGGYTDVGGYPTVKQYNMGVRFGF